eukprot:scaffold201144_cov26-Prasinocladus_malaysianus.AAC.2
MEVFIVCFDALQANDDPQHSNPEEHGLPGGGHVVIQGDRAAATQNALAASAALHGAEAGIRVEEPPQLDVGGAAAGMRAAAEEKDDGPAAGLHLPVAGLLDEIVVVGEVKPAKQTLWLRQKRRVPLHFIFSTY